LNGKSWEKPWRHFHCEFLKQAYQTGSVAIAQMHDQQIYSAKVPFGHDFNKLPIADQLRLHQRRKITDADTSQQSGCKPGIVVH
jgi:hypothetical protein